MALEPFDGGEVEVVGGFVEEENVGGGDEGAGELGAHLPTAAEGAEGFLKAGCREAESAEGGFGAGLQLVAVAMFEFVLQFAQFGHEVGGGVAGDLFLEGMDGGVHFLEVC